MKFIFSIFLVFPIIIFSQDKGKRIDAMVSPKKRSLVLTVGGVNADVPGFTSAAIQIAVDALPEEGGTVKLNSGLYSIKAPVKLPSNVNLIGAGPETILKKVDGFRSKLILDADYGALKLIVEDPSGFEVGMSIMVEDDVNYRNWDVSTGVITDIDGNILYIDEYLIRTYEIEKNGWVSNAGSCVLVEGANNVHISAFTVEGNKDKNDLVDGCVGGGIAIRKSKNITVDNVVVNNFNGEGISWQITENVTVRKCEINGCNVIGLHPGTGSPNSLIEDNIVSHCKIGLYLCWGVENSVVRGNKLYNNAQFGISTGHKDADVIFENNYVSDNGLSGVEFRKETSKNSPHRTTFVNNIIENNGVRRQGYGFIIEGNALDVLLKDNVIRDNKSGTQKAAIFIRKNTPPVKLENNTMSGHKLGNIIHE